MRKWADAQGEIGAAFDQHTILQRKFDAFVKHVSEQLCGPVLKPKELKLFSDDPSNWFEIHFAGRTLRFVFSACRGDGRTLKGRVTCFLLVTFPIARHVELGNFEFNTSGTTNLKIAENDNDPALIHHDAHALCIALDYVCQSLDHDTIGAA